MSHRLIAIAILSIALEEFAIMMVLPNIKGITSGQAGLLAATALSIFSGIIVFLLALFLWKIKLRTYLRLLAS